MSAHLDDAVLSCWLGLTRPATHRVVTAFAGLPAEGTPPSAWDRLTRCVDPRRRVRDRRDEDHRALAGTGCTAVHLDFVGAVHRAGALDTAALRASLSAAIGDAEVVYLPAGIGGHPDHVATRDAVLEATAGRRRLLYADQPYVARFGWPAWVTGRPPAVDGLDVDAWLACQLATARGVSPGQPLVHRLPGWARAEKIRAIAAYRSQLAALTASAGAGFPNGPEWGYEVIWPLS